MIITRLQCEISDRRTLSVVPWLRLAVLLIGLVVLAGCSPQAPSYTEPVSISLADHYPVSERRGPSQHNARPTRAIGGQLLQACDSSLAYYFALPEGAQLVGAGAVVKGKPGASVSVRVSDGQAEARVVYLQELDVDTKVISFSEALGASWGDMMRVEVAVRCEGPGSVLVSWEDLRIEGMGPASPPAPEFKRDRYNVIIVLLDSLRADHLQPYGAKSVLTPRLEQLGRQGVTFLSARSTSSWTRPAVAALLTSQRSINHGIVSLASGLPLHLPYLPAILRKQGYETILIANTAQVSSHFGFNRGFTRVFDHFEHDDASGPRRYHDPVANADDVWKKYIAPAAERAGDKPFFVYLHERDPHAPYGPPPPYDGMYAQDYEGEVKSDLFSIARLRFTPDSASPGVVAKLNGLYSGEVSYMDRYVGALLDHLKQDSLNRKTLVVFTSDHGEEFWDHGSVGHGHTVYEELLQVPLMMRLPGVLPADLATRVPMDLADVTPSILDLLGIDTPDTAEGSSIIPYLFSDAAGIATQRQHFSAAQANAPKGTSTPRATAVTYRNWKLIRIPPGSEREKMSLYDLALDPAEMNDIADAHPIVVATLDQMRRWMRRKHDAKLTRGEEAVDTEFLDDEVEQNLRALGYID